MKKTTKIIFLLVTVLFIVQGLNAQQMEFPGKHWKKYTSPEEAGFSSEKIEVLKQAFAAKGGASLLVIHNGKILLDEGSANRRFRQASIRKSYMSALMGRYIEKGVINLNSTMKDLNIDDINPLTETEKQAKIIDLLAARSGVYHDAAYMQKSNKKYLPERGSHAPGTFWYYNNWDFNTLVTIFNQETGRDFFEAFKKEIASPLQMEDFNLSHTYYRYEEDVSEHPAYLLRMSARDMARFGLLYLNKGKWKNKEIISKDWFEQSTAPLSTELGRGFSSRGSYGLLWWISDGINGEPMYYASGAGGQRICILPESQLILVHLTDTYQSLSVGQQQIDEMITLLLESKNQEPVKNPSVAKFNPPIQKVKIEKADADLLTQIAGTYHHKYLGKFVIQPKGKKGQLSMTTGIGIYNLLPIGSNSFWIEDMDTVCTFNPGETTQKGTLEAVLTEQKLVERVVFFY